MPKSSFHQAAVRAIVTSVPTTERSIDDEVDLFGGNEK
ncbi:MAG: ketoacyl-ACP synthase III, partial [Coraliomargarita sp.]|nr:ketoacyl-ACP synthase III [Coraliomargarita sp.]